MMLQTFWIILLHLDIFCHHHLCISSMTVLWRSLSKKTDKDEQDASILHQVINPAASHRGTRVQSRQFLPRGLFLLLLSLSDLAQKFSYHRDVVVHERSSPANEVLCARWHGCREQYADQEGFAQACNVSKNLFYDMNR